TWATTNLMALGYRPRAAASLLAGFWGTFLAGRLIMAFVFYRASWALGREGWFLVGLGLCLGVALGNLAGSPNRVGVAWGLLFVGLFSGPIFPTLVGTVLGHFPDAPGMAPGTSFGAVYALGALGMLVSTPLIRLEVEPGHVQRALRFPLVAA